MVIAVINKTIALVKDETLIRGMKKTVSVRFSFDPTWDGFTKTVHFRAGSVSETVQLQNDVCDVPASCLANAGVILRVLVAGEKGGETVTTPWCLTSRILYDTDIDVPPGPSPAPSAEVGRLCTELASMLHQQYTEEELENLSLIDVMSEMDGLTNTATDGEVEDLLDDIWGEGAPGEQVQRLCDEFAAALRGKYTDEELAGMSLSDVVVDIDSGNTATDSEVEDAINDIWGSDDDEFIDWLLTLIFDGFKIDVSYMTDEEYSTCMEDLFVKLDYREIPKEKLTGEKWMEKSVDIGDQLSQVIGIYYPYPIDNYVKYVRSQKYYARYMDDWYVMSPSKEELLDILEHIKLIARELGIHINEKKTRIVKISGTYKYLQIKYTLMRNGKIVKRINPARVTAIRRKLKKLAAKYDRGEADYENVENMFKSWMDNYYKLLSKEQRGHLIELYEELFKKSVEIVNKKMVITDKTNCEEGSK